MLSVKELTWTSVSASGSTQARKLTSTMSTPLIHCRSPSRGSWVVSSQNRCAAAGSRTCSRQAGEASNGALVTSSGVADSRRCSMMLPVPCCGPSTTLIKN